MVKRGASIGFFGLFGRSQDMRLLDDALRRAGLHPGALSEGAKLAAVTLMSRDGTQEPPPAAYVPVGELMAFCALGAEAFAQHNGAARLAMVTGRMESALETGEGEDAELILLMLHAGLLDAELIARYDIRAEGAD